MKVRIAYFAIMTFLFNSCGSARILALFPRGSKSHKIAGMPIVEALAARGHEVTVISAFKTNPVENVKEVLLEKLALLFTVYNEFDWFGAQKMDGLTEFKTTMRPDDWKFVMDHCIGEFKNNIEFQRIMKERNVDLVLMDGLVCECIYPYIQELDVPFVFHISSANLPWSQYLFEELGASADYASVPTAYADLSDQMTFWERLWNLRLTYEFHSLQIKTTYIMEDYIRQLNDFPNFKSLSEFRKEVSLVLVNSNPTTDWPRALPPNIVPIGAPQAKPAKPLSEPFKKFADEAKEGFIIFSLGTIVHGNNMPQETFDTFLRVFSKLPQRVIWRWEGKRPDKIPSHIMMADWIPQQDLLGHTNIKLVITHGGMLGVQEAVYHAVPYLGWPFAFDQKSNVAMLKRRGMGLKLDWDKVNDENVYNLISEILNNSSYKDNAIELSNMMKDQLLPGGELGAYWIEYVLRHKDEMKLLRLAFVKMPFYKVYLLDFAFVVVSITVLCLLIIYRVFRFIRPITSEKPETKFKAN